MIIFCQKYVSICRKYIHVQHVVKFFFFSDSSFFDSKFFHALRHLYDISHSNFVQDICLKDMIAHIQCTKNHECHYGPVL